MDDLPDLVGKLPIGVQYLLAGLVAAGSLVALLGILRPMWARPMHKLWPGREGWSAECMPPHPGQQYQDDELLNPDRAWQGGAMHRWSQMRAMWKGDYFQLHLGKPRVLSRIQGVTDGNKYPLRYELQLSESDNADWKSYGEHDGPIDMELGKPTKVVAMRFEITEPDSAPSPPNNMPPAWGIYDDPDRS